MEYLELTGTICDYLGLFETIWGYLGISGTSIWDFLGLSWTWVQVETGESKLLLFETFSLVCFFLNTNDS